MVSIFLQYKMSNDGQFPFLLYKNNKDIIFKSVKLLFIISVQHFKV